MSGKGIIAIIVVGLLIIIPVWIKVSRSCSQKTIEYSKLEDGQQKQCFIGFARKNLVFDKFEINLDAINYG